MGHGDRSLVPPREGEWDKGTGFLSHCSSKKAQDMRKVEEKIRNSAAHNITAIREEDFLNLAGISSHRLLLDMQWLFKYTFPEYFNSNINLWDSYDQMNEEIIRTLKSG